MVYGLKDKYIAEDATSRKLLVNNFNVYKMIENRPIIE